MKWAKPRAFLSGTIACARQQSHARGARSSTRLQGTFKAYDRQLCCTDHRLRVDCCQSPALLRRAAPSLKPSSTQLVRWRSTAGRFPSIIAHTVCSVTPMNVVLPSGDTNGRNTIKATACAAPASSHRRDGGTPVQSSRSLPPEHRTPRSRPATPARRARCRQSSRRPQRATG